MLFYASIRRELSQSFSATLIVLLSIVMTMMLIKTLGLASKGNVDPQDVFLIMAYMSLSYLPIVLTLALFLSTTNTLARQYKDSEMAVWFSSGVGLLQFVRPLLRFAWPVLLMIAILGLFGWPWANRQIDELRSRYEQRGDADRIAPGEFQQNKSGTRVFFTDSSSQNSSGGNIFIHSRSPERATNSTTTAQTGKIERTNDGTYLTLDNGQSVSYNDESRENTVSYFAQYRTMVNDRNLLDGQANTPTKMLASDQLIASPAGRGELFWRIGLVICALNFVLLALALTKTNNRSGKSVNMIMALLAFAVYYNLLNVGQSWISTEKLSFTTLFIGLHGGMLLLIGVLLLQRQHNWSLANLLPRRSS